MTTSSDPQPQHKGWHSRGYLPHFDSPGKVQSLTIHLFDTVPAEIVEKWKHDLTVWENLPADDFRMISLRKHIEKYADQGHGCCYLRDPKIARLVEDTIRHFDNQRYRLFAWCIMPNHVHALIEQNDGWPLSSVLHSWKSYSAQMANRLLSRRGEFWLEDYFDRFIRDREHFDRTVSYIEMNPVAAGLVKYAEDWEFSSARKRREAAKA